MPTNPEEVDVRRMVVSSQARPFAGSAASPRGASTPKTTRAAINTDAQVQPRDILGNDVEQTDIVSRLTGNSNKRLAPPCLKRFSPCGLLSRQRAKAITVLGGAVSVLNQIKRY
jgi:hypothetical protein